MGDQSQSRFQPVTIALLAAALITAGLGVAVGFRFFTMPRPVRLVISEPAGATVICDLVVDGRPETRRATVPVDWKFDAKKVDFAVIPEHAAAGDVHVELSSQHGWTSAAGAGIRGNAEDTAAGSGVSIGGMTMTHVETMRAARTAAGVRTEGTDQPEPASAGSQKSDVNAREQK